MNPQQQIDEYVSQQNEWQKQNLVSFRELIHSVEPQVEETWKWNVPVFVVNKKLVCAMSTFKDHTKFNFFEGAQLHDVDSIFNNGLTSKKQRSVDMSDVEQFNEKCLRALLEQAVAVAKK